MSRERSSPGRRRALKIHSVNAYGDGVAETGAGSVSVYDSCGTNPTSSTGQYDNQALPTTFSTGTGPNMRESEELLR